MDHPRYAILRIYETARTAHLERLAASRQSRLVFRKKSYDFDPTGGTLADVRQLGRLRTLLEIARSRPRFVELNEPGQLSAWPSLLLYVSLIRALNLRRRERIRLVYYAIENADTLENVRSYSAFGNPIMFWVGRMTFKYLVNSAYRIAFGTGAAMEQYTRNCPGMRAEQRLIVALPAARDVTAAKEAIVAFVGSLEERKGVLILMQAWDLCRRPNASLLLMGKGPLEPVIAAWAATRPDVTLHLNPERHVVWSGLQRARVTVLFSQPERRWREQIGLPIVEGLSCGCEIVASSESGLADWLSTHGHHVLSPDAGAQALADAIDSALASDRTAAEVVAPLPPVDGRISADDWLTR